MEITQTVTLLAGIAVVIAAVTYTVSLVIALRRTGELKVVSRMALRRQLHNTYMDIDWNLTEDDNFEAAVKKTVNAIDMSGVAFEKVKSDFEAEQERKRNEPPPVYQDPTPTEKSKNKNKKRNR